MPDPVDIDLTDIEPMEVSATFAPANRWGKLFQKSQWSVEQINDLPDSAFLHIENGGEKDGAGKTTPRSLRHFPYRHADGTVDRAHLTNAIARIPQADIPADEKTKLQERARKLLEQLNQQERSMPLSKSTLEFVEKMSADAKAKCMKAFDSLSEAKSGMSAEEWGKFQKAFAFEGKETPAEELAEEKKQKAAIKKSADEATAALATANATLGEAKEMAKSAVAMLEGEKPDLAAAVTKLASFAGVTPKSVLIAQLPVEVKAQFEAMQKSSAAAAEQLAAMQKKIDEQAAEARKADLIQKSSKLYPAIPVKHEEIAALQLALPESLQATFSGILAAANEHIAKSAMFSEIGTSAPLRAPRPGAPQVGGSAAHAKVVEMARDMVQKSSGGLTEAQAITQIYLQHPELYAQHDAERPAAPVKP